MNWREMPPLASLRAFEAAARLASFTRAGAELNVSHAAISQQVRQLETFLDTALLARAGRGLALTADGAALSRNLSEAFTSIARATGTLSQRSKGRAMHVTTTPTFALGWLLPRLGDFRAAHPGIELMLNPTPEIIDLQAAGIDLGIRFGIDNWQGVETELLVPTGNAVVARPDLVARYPVRQPADLVTLPWLQETGTSEVSRWLAKHGVLMPDQMNITHLPVYMLMPALLAGEGVTATAKVIVAPDIEAGRLAVLFEERRPGEGYYLVHPPGPLRAQARIFAAWLRRQAGTPPA